MGFSSQNSTDANDNAHAVLKDDGGDSIGQTKANPLFVTENETINHSSDIFGRKRVSTPAVEFDTYFVETAKPLLIDTKVTGGATATRNATTKQFELTCGTASGDRAILQTKQYFHYIPGIAKVLELTGGFGVAKENVSQRIGFFDDDNGIFFEILGTAFGVVQRSSVSGSVVNTRVEQADFNVDSLDGTGPSGATLSLIKNVIWSIDYQWLGSGSVRFGVELDGIIVTVHVFNNSDVIAVPYMQTGSLPIRYECENTGIAASSTTVRCVCMAVVREGAAEPVGRLNTVTTIPGSAVAVNTSTFVPLLSIRLKAVNKRGILSPVGISVLATSNDDIMFKTVINGSLTGASWASSGTNSIAEMDTSATALTGGALFEGGMVSKSGGEVSRTSTSFIPVVADIDGNVDVFTVIAISLSSAANIHCVINFEERF